MGQNFKFVPFWGGRRGCPGTYLYLYAVMNTTIAAMVQCFDGKLIIIVDMEMKT